MMQPERPLSRTHSVRTMSSLRLLIRLSAPLLALLVGVGCSAPDATDQDVMVEAAAAPAVSVGASSVGADEVSVFPMFLPAVGFGSEASDCALGTDPYSSCI